MSIADDLRGQVKSIFAGRWELRDGNKVPEPEDIQLGNVGVKLDATVLYADLAQSTTLVTSQTATFAAEVYKAYLYCAAKLIAAQDGVITAYDGDRIMAVFIGERRNSRAAITALKLNDAVRNVINPALHKQYPDRPAFNVEQAVGIDSSQLMVARTGIRKYNDLVWVGRAANYAAKLCGLRNDGYASYITADVFKQLATDAKLSSDGREMWEARTWTAYGIRIYRSNWSWSI